MLTPRHVLMSVDAVGGVWSYALDLAAGLSALGMETTLLGFGPPPSPEQRRAAERVARLDWCDLPLDWTGEDADVLARVPERIAEHAARAGADIIQVNQPSQAAGIVTDLPVIAVSHSCVTSWFRTVRGSGLPRDWAWREDLTARGLKAAATVIAPSRAHARLMAQCYPGLGGVAVVSNATPARPAPAAKRDYAYAAARWWDEGKNAGTLDAAAAHAPIPVLAAGATEGPSGQSVAFRHARGIGRIDPDALNTLAVEAAIFVSPSIYEPFGLAALEAAAARAALVLADIPTYREIWDGAAIFVDPHDPEGFAAAVAALANDPAQREALSREAAARAARHTPEIQAGQMAGLYRAARHRVAEQAV